MALLELLGFLSPTKKGNTLDVSIKTSTGIGLPVSLNPAWTIDHVKTIIGPKMDLDPEEIKIIFAGKELAGSVLIQECDLGQQSILHAVKILRRSNGERRSADKPLTSTVVLQQDEHENSQVSETADVKKQSHFFVWCTSPCKQLCRGKLRVRCSKCKELAMTVDTDPCGWDDVLIKQRITGVCDMVGCDGLWAEFYFKCSEHPSLGEDDEAIALYQIKHNFRDVPCLACTDTSSTVFVFDCASTHVMCLDCYKTYCLTRLNDRQFTYTEKDGYTLPCAAGCEDSYIQETHHFRFMGDEQYARYQRFGAEECVLASGGVLCPQPGCGMGILPDSDGCRRVVCQQGCQFVFCRECLQGYHIGECDLTSTVAATNSTSTGVTVSETQAAQSRWNQASQQMIQVTTKPCPKCRTATERDGGCMHMVCTRAGCLYHWCWVCQTEWTRECMAAHWFG